MWLQLSRVGLALGAVTLCLFTALGLASGQGMTVGHAVGEAARQIAELFPVMKGLVVEVDNNRLFVDFGARRGAYQGMELEVFREGEEIKHPVTGQPLGRREVRLATVGVVDVKEEFSEAVVMSQEKEAKLSWGDRVRVSGDRITVALPFIDSGEVRNANVRSVTKDLAIALMKTGRFMVVEEHLIRSSLDAGQGLSVGIPSDSSALKVLAEKLRAQALILGKLSSADKEVFLDLHVLSTKTGATLGVVSIQLPGN